MYLEHFGLREEPFRITPHTEFFFPGAKRKATLEALIYAATHDEGIIKVSGEVGSGKTMLCRMLLETLPKTAMTVYFASPSLSRDELLDMIAEEIGAPESEKGARHVLRSIQKRLIDLYAEGRQVIIMVDEAHAMPTGTIEEIRLLSNLESKRHKLLHIVLFGQPELDERLLDQDMRPLKERITHNFALSPLRHDEIGEYLMFRMRRAGYRGPDLFTPGAVRLISRVSEGLTRRVNILADKALLSAFSESKHLIDARQIKVAIEDAQFSPMGASSLTGKWVGGIFAAILMGIAIFLGYPRIEEKPPLPVASNAANAMANSRETRVAARRAAGERSAALPAPPSDAGAIPAGTGTILPSGGITNASALPAALPDPVENNPPTLEERVAMTKKWLEATPNSHFFIQLFSAGAGNRRAVESFLEQMSDSLDRQQVRVYRSSLSGQERYGVIYGDYPVREAAQTELDRLKRLDLIRQAYVRNVSKLR